MLNFLIDATDFVNNPLLDVIVDIILDLFGG